MPFATMKQSGHLKVQRIASPEEFRAIGFVDIERLRLLGPYFYGRAITALPGILLMLERTSPRNLSAMMDAAGCTVVVPMADQTAAVFNGHAWSSSNIGLVRNETPFNLCEPRSNTFAVIRFSSDMQNCGWEEVERRLHLHAAGGDLVSRLQEVILHIFRLSSSMPYREFAIAGDALRQELLESLNQVLVCESARHARSRSFERYRRLVSRLDEFALLHPEIPLYSEALAREFGTSVRTLQLAVQAVHGASLHQHLRTKRLWSIRAQLAKGTPTTSVSSVGIANGFLHMSELARLYKATFGELPSETLSRGRNA